MPSQQIKFMFPFIHYRLPSLSFIVWFPTFQVELLQLLKNAIASRVY